MAAITLYQFSGVGGLSVSPYCNKVHWALRLKGLVYRTEDLVRARSVSRTARLPVLVYDGEKVHDSTAIVRFLEARHPAPALRPAGARDAALSFALEEWADEALHPFAAYYRWRERASLGLLASVTLPAVRPGLARLAMNVPRNRIRRGLRPLGALGEAAVREEFERNLDALEAMLAGRAWLFGDAPGAADIAVAAQLHMLMLGNTPEPLGWVRARPALGAWLDAFLARASRVPWHEG
jgi:glutathione S-transferase